MPNFFSEKNVLILDQDKLVIGFVAVNKAFVLEDRCGNIEVTFVKAKKNHFKKYKKLLQEKGVILLDEDDFDLKGV